MLERQKKLLQLLAEQTEHKPASFFSSRLKVSRKTVYSDLQELDAYLKHYDIQIDRLPGSGIRLTDSGTGTLAQILCQDREPVSLDLEARRMFILRELFIRDENLTLEQLSSRFLVSKTSLYKDLDWIRHLNAEEKIELQSAAEGIQCFGEERSIQKTLFFGIMEETGRKAGGRWLAIRNLERTMFDEDICQAVDRTLTEDYADLTEGVSEYYLYSLRIILLIFLSRLRRHHHMEKDKDFLFNTIRYMETFVVANSMAERLGKELNLSFETDDVEYMSRQLFAHRITTQYRRTDPDHTRLVMRLIRRLEEVEKVDLSGDSQLFQSLLYHFPAMILRLRKNILVENPLLEEIQKQYSELFRIMWYVLSVVESEYGVKLNDHEVSFVLIYFQLAMDRVSKARNILVICPYGISSSQLILSRIKQFLPARDTIEAASLQKLQTGTLDNVDLVITSVDPGPIDVPCVRVSPLITDEDLVHVLNVYTSAVLASRQLPTTLKKLSAPVLASLTKPEWIFTEKECASRKECLDCLCAKLEEKKCVIKGYRESVFSREEMGATALDSGAALPHADPDLVTTSTVAVMTLKKPVRWGDVQVSLVIMAAISQRDAGLFHNLIMEIYTLISDRKVVDDLVSVSDPSVFYQLFTPKGESNVF